MRRLVSISILCAAVPVAAAAQETPSRTAEDYVCELTGECAEADQTEPESETVGERGRARVSATRGFSLSRPAKPAAKPGSASTASTSRATAAAPRATGKKAVKTASTTKAKPTATRPGRVDLRLSFPLASAELTPQAKAEARVFAQALQLPQLSGKKFVIEGHTDSQGGREYNLDLSQRRARAVADYLVSLGVSRDRFEVRGYGYDRPLPGRSAASQDNRRVEAVLVS